MEKDNKYTFNKYILKFKDKRVEESYKNIILTKTLIFYRIAWGIAASSTLLFSIMDPQEFAKNEALLLKVRLTIVAISIVVVAFSFNTSVRKFYDKATALFILMYGFFTVFLIVMNTSIHFSPYFFSFFFVFAGIFLTVGLGFRFSIISMIINLFVWETTILAFFPVIPRLQILYSLFLPTGIIIFSYAAYIIEHISRQNYIKTIKLQDSIDEISTLHGLLPICSNCKKIRDDQGYWSQIEEYLNQHGYVSFTHSICPECTIKLYPQMKFHRK